uniref:Meis_PKNOX_N domain-containing protein n=1 Tax=Steinernema glaseri TaxID=37863 RepID=A0A1I7XXE1_9BILA
MKTTKPHIKDLFRELERKKVSTTTGNDEVDQLVHNAILVLRTNVVELTKVSDLSKMFRSKYMQSIKKTMNQESMIGLSADSDDDFAPEATVSAFGLNPENFAQYGFSNFENLSDTFALMNSTNNGLPFPFQLLSFQHQFHNVASNASNVSTTNDQNGSET